MQVEAKKHLHTQLIQLHRPMIDLYGKISEPRPLDSGWLAMTSL